MAKTAVLYTETLAILAVVAVAVHHLADLDWPWAIVAGAAVAVLARNVLQRRTVARR